LSSTVTEAGSQDDTSFDDLSSGGRTFQSVSAVRPLCADAKTSASVVLSIDEKQTMRKPSKRGDPRMLRAVKARLADHKMSLLDALLVGGFDFSILAKSGERRRGLCDRSTFDKDNVSLCQRKNQLNRRLRERRMDDPRYARAVQEVLADPNISLLEALVAGGFDFPATAKDYTGEVDSVIEAFCDRTVRGSDNITLHQRKIDLRKILAAAKISKESSSLGGVHVTSPTTMHKKYQPTQQVKGGSGLSRPSIYESGTTGIADCSMPEHQHNPMVAAGTISRRESAGLQTSRQFSVKSIPHLPPAQDTSVQSGGFVQGIEIAQCHTNTPSDLTCLNSLESQTEPRINIQTATGSGICCVDPAWLENGNRVGASAFPQSPRADDGVRKIERRDSFYETILTLPGLEDCNF